MRLLFIILACGSFELYAQTSYVAPTTILQKSGYQLGIGGDYWKSSKRVDKEGEKIDYQDGESFSRIQGEVFGAYGLTENLQVGGGARFRQNASTFLNEAGDEKETKTSTGIESTFANFIYAFQPVDRLQYVLEGGYHFRPFTNSEINDGDEGNLILGDDGHQYFVGLGVTYASPKSNFLTGRLGYRNPGKDLSTELYWQLEGAMAWNNFALVAGVNGIHSLKNDPYEDDPENRPIFNTGATNLYKGENREMIAPYAGVNLAFGENWRVELRGSQVVTGKSTDLGTSFGINLIRRVEEKPIKKTDRTFKEYDFEATITKISPKKGYVVIDRGLSEDVQKGMKIDFFEFDYVGGNILLARGIVIRTGADTSIVKITQRFNTKKELKEGTVARGSYR